jgi:hypothetical protein
MRDDGWAFHSLKFDTMRIFVILEVLHFVEVSHVLVVLWKVLYGVRTTFSKLA